MPGKLFKQAQKLNKYATTLDDEDTLSKIGGFVSTQCYAINAIFSADLFGGIPKGRVTTLFGPSQSGKSFISALSQKSAQDDDMDVVIFDTEFDKDGRMEKSLGVDLSRVLTVPIESVEELIIQSTKMLDEIIEDESEHGKYLFILDSLGFLASEKQLEDASKKNKVAMDMGLKAKLIKQWFSNLKGKISKTGCPFVIINHEIANPNQMYESIFKEQGGGKSTEFVSTVMAHISAKKEKQDSSNEKDVQTMMAKKEYSGQHIRVFTQKNRCAIPHKETEVYLNYATGIDKYSGLGPLLEKLDTLYLKDAQGNIGKGRTYYLKDGDEEIKLGSMKEWRHNEEIWAKILPQLNEVVKSELAYRAHV
jgi:RecA/RadA recombinase